MTTTMESRRAATVRPGPNARVEPAGSGAGDAIRSVAEIVDRILPGHGTLPAVRYDDGAEYRTLTFAEVVGNVRRALRAVPALPNRQQVVCTFVKNRPEWDMMALACLHGGNVLFPLDTDMNDTELIHLLRQSPPDVVLVSAASRGRMRSALGEAGIAARVLVADLYRTFEDPGAPPAGPPEAGEELLSSAAAVDPGVFPPPSPRLEDPETVLGHYATSGTTRLPSVVRITHGNMVAQVNEGRGVINLRPNEDVLNIGAYTHIATLLEFLVTKLNGFCVTYVTREVDEDDVLEREIRKLKRQGVRIKGMMGVPRFWIFLMKEVLEEMKNKPVWKRLYAHLTSIETHAQLVDLGTLDRAKLSAVRIYLRNRMGGHFTYGISSSSRIDPGVIEIFARLGVTVIDIYGATEASGIIARNRLNESRRGSCGRLIDCLEYRIANPRLIPGQAEPVGELLVKGPTISRGYAGEPDGAHLDADGFYPTGDLARVDADGWVYLLGREKELIHWDDGSVIDPMHLSNLLVRSIWVKDAMVARLGEDDALRVFVFPDRERLRKDRGYQAELAAGVPADEALRRRLLEAVAYAESLAAITPRLSTERIYLLPRKLERTPTHKIKFVREMARLQLDRFV
jgi:long-chain acyl-CoA synthetase